MVAMTVRLGVIGSSAGNGHPYSWSAIFNGYDVEAMQECEYPVIPGYLSAQSWPDAKISGAEVSSIWTQNSELSARIAKASCIEHISSTIVELESRVDAVLLARDDAENHLHFDFLPILLFLYHLVARKLDFVWSKFCMVAW